MSKKLPREPVRFRDYAAQVIEERLEKMLSYVEGVRMAEDIEAVHDMRVASRRLRAALSIFSSAFPATEFAHFEREVKMVTRALGNARDLDVMIETLQQLDTLLPEHQRAGMEAFIAEKASERKALQKDVQNALDHLEKSDLRGKFAQMLVKTRETHEFSRPQEEGKEPTQTNQNGSAAGPEKGRKGAAMALTLMPGIHPDNSITENAAIIIPWRIQELLEWEKFVSDPTRVYELHQMRIAAKRLRYTLEIFAPFYGREFSLAIEKIKGFQEQLGSIHDADVLVPQLGRNLKESLQVSTKRAERLGVYTSDFKSAAGLISLCLKLTEERESTYRRFLADWHAARAEKFFEALIEQVNQQAQKPPICTDQGSKGDGEI
jgi:CHAD domain-containing protein